MVRTKQGGPHCWPKIVYANPLETKDEPNNHEQSNVQSLDEQYLSKDDQIQINHVYYEPKKMCNIQINYGNTVFHLHTVTLAQNSVYFLNLFEESDMKESIIELPSMKDFCDKTIDVIYVKSFFDILYMYEPIQYNDLIDDEPKYSLFPLTYLSHYFQAERLEKNLMDVASEFIAQRFGEENIPFILKLAIFSQYCKWTEIEDSIVKDIRNNIKDFLSFINTDILYWPKINISTKQRIQSKLKKRKLASEDEIKQLLSTN